MSRSTDVSVRARRVHPVDQVPPVPKLLTYGFQHVAAFYAGAVIVPLIIGGVLGVSGDDMIKLIQADLLTCGIASLLQAIGFRIGRFRVGVQLPLLQGVAFAGVAPIITIGFMAGGGSESLPLVFGSVIVGGILFFLVAPLIARLVRFFPPVVTGSVLTIIGITLLPVAANHAIGGQLGLPGFDWSYGVMGASPGGHGDPTSSVNFAFAIGTVLVILLLQRFFKGFLSTISVLLGLIAGTVVWYIVHPDSDWSGVADAGWFWFATPFHFGMPRFEIVPALLILLVMMITAVETVGSLYATGDIVGRRIRKDDIAAALRADGLSTVLGGTMGSFPYTCFAENIGLVRVTGVKSRWIVAVAGGFMMVLGLFPKAAALVGMIPEPVLGGAALVLFAAVAVVGIQTLSTVNFNDHRNLIVAGTSIAIGVYVMAFPAVQDAVPEWLQWYFSGGIAAGAFTALLLNVLFFHVGPDRGPAIAKSATGTRVHLAEINDMDREQFERTFSSVVQGSAWAIERAFALRPYPSAAALGEAFQDALLMATPEEQAALLNTFPDLGRLDDDGQPVAREHGQGALDGIGEDEQAEIAELSRAYVDRFGFPLVMSAREHERYDQVLRAGWTRMDNSPATERQAALIEVSKIVNHRYEQIVADANPISSARFGRFAHLGTE
ncbi:solute carrier family 23 protein [Microbacterium sp. No. 7]|uniref:solute carrier family 23 protein n=1 Tax=Microbacterium sp. No. 7 TaxID=1714373 RepID=UPI0006D06BAF|nr:solute carrier family 23 protein [Microbacterium sp. No. 7]ALJ19977.1 xanthine permease [Microbacterium sp. No. 7]